VENFHHRGGNIGPPIEVEFSTIFIYSVTTFAQFTLYRGPVLRQQDFLKFIL